jgi:hypothetical protein
VAETAALLREKAARCRRIADLMVNQNDPAAKALLTMADELEAVANSIELPPDDNT